MKLSELTITDWQTSTDAALAARCGVRRQAASAFRKSHDFPPSPAGHGGARRGAVSGASIAARLDGVCKRCGSTAPKISVDRPAPGA